MESNASRLENEVKSTTTAKLEKRSHVYTEEELRLHRLVYDPLPQVNLRSEETRSAMADAVPWEYINVEDIGMGKKDGVVHSLNLSTRHLIPNEGMKMQLILLKLFIFRCSQIKIPLTPSHPATVFQNFFFSMNI